MIRIAPLDFSVLDEMVAHGHRRQETLYALFDGAGESGLFKLLRRGDLPWLSVFTQGQEGERRLLAASPLLVRVEGAEDLLRLLRRCDGLPMVSLWSTTETLGQLGARLLPWCVVKADDQYLHLRFPDTRRLPDLVQILSDEQRSQFFGPCSACWYPARGGGWQSLGVPGQFVPAAERVELDTAQTCQLIRNAEPDEVLYRMVMGGLDLAGYPPGELHERIQQALIDADKAGTEDAAERYRLCQKHFI